MTRTVAGLPTIAEFDWRTETTFPVVQTGHTVFLSYAGQGKTTSAMKWFRSALARDEERQFLVLDSSSRWQHARSLIKKGEFQHLTIGEQGRSLRLNLCKIPEGWSSDPYADVFAALFAQSFGLDGSDERLVSSVLKTMYELKGADQAPEKSSAVTLDSVYRFIRTMMHRFELLDEPHQVPEWIQLKRLSTHFYRFSVGQRDHDSFGRHHRQGVDAVCFPNSNVRVTLVDCYRANPQTRQLVFGLISRVALEPVPSDSAAFSTRAKTLIVDSKEGLFDGGLLEGQLPTRAKDTVQVVYTASRVSALSAQTMKRIQTLFVGRLYHDDYRHLLSVFRAGDVAHFVDRVMWLRDGEFLCLRRRRTPVKVSFLPPR